MHTYLKTKTLSTFLKALAFCFLASLNVSAKTLVVDSKKALLEQTATYSDLHLFPNLHPTTNFKISFEFIITKQYRPKPNPWETLWIFWSYNLDGNNNKFTNYFAFKTNGIEIGKAYEHVAQDFLYTSEFPKIEIQKWNKVQFESKNSVLRFKFNDDPEIDIPADKIKGLYKTPGRWGLYVEDARAHVKNYKLEIF